jgi:hypothetical protein
VRRDTPPAPTRSVAPAPYDLRRSRRHRQCRLRLEPRPPRLLTTSISGLPAPPMLKMFSISSLVAFCWRSNPYAAPSPHPHPGCPQSTSLTRYPLFYCHGAISIDVES